MVYVTGRTPALAGRHEHFAGVRWLGSNSSTSQTMAVAEAVQWIRHGGASWLAGDTAALEVQVVDAFPPHLRTVADNEFTDSLLALQRD